MDIITLTHKHAKSYLINTGTDWIMFDCRVA